MLEFKVGCASPQAVSRMRLMDRYKNWFDCNTPVNVSRQTRQLGIPSESDNSRLSCSSDACAAPTVVLSRSAWRTKVIISHGDVCALCKDCPIFGPNKKQVHFPAGPENMVTCQLLPGQAMNHPKRSRKPHVSQLRCPAATEKNRHPALAG